MIVSKVNWQYLYWVEHKNAEALYTISMEDFQKLQSGNYYFDDWKVIEIIKETPELTEEEKEDIIMNTIVSIKVPLVLLDDLKEKINTLILMFSELKRNPEWEYLVLSNITYKYVPQFLTQDEYDQLKSAWVIFDDLINDLYSK